MMRFVEVLKGKRCLSLWPLFLFFMLILAASVIFSSGMKESCAQEKAAQAAAQLTIADCVKCHPKVVATVDEKGSKHKTAVNCMDCHKGHPPMVSKENIIPLCSMCHSGKPHYEIGGCNTCHSDPHAPLQMQLAANITGPCLSCHPKQGQELKDHPSKHTQLFCTSCHTKHKEVPPCATCHRPHTESMTNKDCLICHPAHQPLTITYGPDMPSNFCAPCHQTIFNTLAATKTKHSALACVFCHKEKHGMVPQCETCHGSPHPAAMMKEYPQCNMCHVSAHSLGKEAK